MSWLLGICVVVTTTISCAGAGPAAVHRPAAPASLDPVIRDVCDKRVVLLGEDGHHGGGATLEVKSELVRRLIDDCGFGAVLFESNLAEFVDVERAFADGSATPAHVADAIGGLWSVYEESDRLVEVLFDRRRRRKVILGGLDGQIGSTNLYAQTRLAGELAGHLAEPRRAECRTDLERHATWSYSDAAPFDDAARARLERCLTDVAAVAPDEAAAMARATWTGIQAQSLPEPDGLAVRDRGMYDAFRWHAARLSRDTKVIVWCANIHAAKTLQGITGWMPLGAYVHRDLGAAAAAIGVSALTGSYGRPNRPAITIATAPADSLEARAFAAEGATDLRYLRRADLARTMAHAIAYDQVATLPWHEVLDGLIVLRAERPPVYVHDRTPRRAGAR